MQVLAPLVDFVHHAQQGRRGERERFHLLAGSSDGGLAQYKSAVTESFQERRTEIPQGTTHRDNELRRIGFDIELAFYSHHGLDRVERTVPLEFLLTAALVAGSSLRD